MIDDLVFYIQSEGELEKVVNMEVTDRGITISPKDQQVRLTEHELHYLSAIAFVYIGADIKELILEPKFIMEKAFIMYERFIKGDYLKKAMEDMSLSDFDEEMRGYDGRDKK